LPDILLCRNTTILRITGARRKGCKLKWKAVRRRRGKTTTRRRSKRRSNNSPRKNWRQKRKN
jgi:hypothetical protein